ncbi:hypothetical protein BKH41_01530, partial [Helicobacter sp. 12S02232-10]|uniref:beta strand repeat-containing protein n=1 Tax=Helicobacter sp. 12S02232-10 TaxID=1476197 RepID=UPI000BCF7F01
LNSSSLKDSNPRDLDTPFQNKNSSKTKKKFSPLFSFVLAALLFPFSGEILRADDLIKGDTSCAMGGGASCAQLITNTPFPKLDLTKGNDGIYQFTYTQASATDKFPDTVVLDANKAIVRFSTINMNWTFNGLYGDDTANYNVKTTINFKDSLWLGYLGMIADNWPHNQEIKDAIGNFTLNFNGGYQGTAHPEWKGYAYIGNLFFYATPMPTQVNFTNNIFKGDIAARSYKWGLSFNNAKWIGNIATMVLAPGATTTLRFNKSTWIGNADADWGGDVNATFIDSKMTGRVKNSTTGTWNWTLNNSTIDASDPSTGGIGTGNNGTLNLTATNGSTIKGDMKASFGVINLKLNNASMTGAIKNSTTTTWNWTADNSTIDASTGGITIGNYSTLNLTATNNSTITSGQISNTASTLNFNLRENSKNTITGKITNGANMIWNLDHSSVQASADLNNNGYAANTKIIAKNQSTFQSNIFNQKGNVNLTFSSGSAYIGNIRGKQNPNYVNVNETLNFTDSSMEVTSGNALKNIYARYPSSKALITANFSGNNASKGYALKGDIESQTGNITLNLSNQAKWIGNVSGAPSNGETFRDGTYTINLDNSQWEGNAFLSYGSINAHFTNNASMTGKLKNSTASTWNWTADNSTIDTSTGGIAIGNNSTFNLTATNSSTIKGNVNSIDANSKYNLTLDASKSNGSITSNGTLNITAKNKSELGAITSNGGTFTLDASSGSKVGEIKQTAGTGNITFSENASAGNITLSGGGGSIAFKGVKNTTLGDIKITGGSAFIQGDISASSIGAIQSSSSSDSSLTFNAMQGQSIGAISGTNGSGSFKGSISGTLDFNPTTLASKDTLTDTSNNSSPLSKETPTQDSNTPKSLTIGSINADTLGLTLKFGGTDAKQTDGSVIGKLSTATTISSDDTSKSSFLTFDHLSNLDFSKVSTEEEKSSTSNDLSTLLKTQTNIDTTNFKGSLGITHTNVILNANSQDASVFSKSNASETKGIIQTTSNASGLNATFGNATLDKDASGHLIIVPNTPANATNQDANSLIFYTLTQKGASHTQEGTASDKSAEGTADKSTEGTGTSGTIDKSTETAIADITYTDGYIQGKSSDANIGYANDHFKKNINFVFTPKTFDASKAQSGYTGTILGGTNDSTYGFYNAGLLKVSQIYQAVGNVSLINTTLSGILGQTKKTDDSTEVHPDINYSFDFSSNNGNTPPSAYGMAVVGQGEHKLTFDFSGNTKDIKFAGSILGGKANASGDSSSSSGTDSKNNISNSITIYNLAGLDNTIANSNAQASETNPLESIDSKESSNSTNTQSILNALNNAGFTAINNTNPQKASNDPSDLDGFSGVTADDKKPIIKGSQIAIYGSSFKGDLVENDYSLNLNFYGNQTALDHTSINDLTGLNHPLKPSSFEGQKIDLENNSFAQTLTFSGEGSIIANQTNTALPNVLRVYLGSGATNLNFNDTGAILALQTKATINSSDNTTTYAPIPKDSQLNLTNNSLIGDWTQDKDLTLAFGDVPQTDSNGNAVNLQSKFYGALSQGNGAALNLTLNPNSLYDINNASDITLLEKSYEGSLKQPQRGDAPHTFKAPSVTFKNTDASKNILNLNHPGGTLEIKGLKANTSSSASDGVMLGAGSSLIANHTTLIGDLYTQLKSDTPNNKENGTYYNLSFDTTNPSESSYFQTNHIGMGVTNGKTGSSITAIGLHSLRSM